MVRRVHEEGLRERRNMKEERRTRKDGSWCVVGKDSDKGFESGLQAWKLSKEDAEEEKEELDNNEEFSHFTHVVMSHEEYEEWVEENNLDNWIPWK